MPLKKFYRCTLAITCILGLTAACKSEPTAAPAPQLSSQIDPDVTDSTASISTTEEVTEDVTEEIAQTEATASVDTRPSLYTQLAPGEFSIGGFTLGTRRAEVIQQLGEPNSVGRYLSDEVGALEYDGITIFLIEDGVAGIIATAPNFCTPSGICPGDTMASVSERLSPAKKIYTDEKGSHVVYSASREEKAIACWMEVYMNEPSPDTEDTVRDLRIVCQP